MDPRTLQLIQRALVAAVTVVLALVVVTAFVRVLEPADETAAVRTTISVPDTTEVEESTSTTAGDVTTTTNLVTTPAICIEDEPSSDAATVLQVFFPCGSTDLAIGGTYVYRAVAPTDLVLTATLREMAKGLEPDEAALGYKSPFPTTAEGSSLGLTLSEGTAFVEFTIDIFPDGVNTPEGAQIFLSTLNANVFQFGSVNQVEYRLGGSCDAFWQQLGSGCEIVTRAQWQAQLSGG